MSFNSKIIITDNTHPYENKIKIKDLRLGTIFKFKGPRDQKDYIYMKISNKSYAPPNQNKFECVVFEIFPIQQDAFSYLDGDDIAAEVYDYEITLSKKE